MVVGTLGSAGERWAELTASASSLPSFTSGRADAMGAKNQSSRPPTTSVNASGVPLNGTCCASMPARSLNFSAFMWVALPMPADA